ncbi:unnamed protein product, partial [Mesorhabditis belari]|uniref:very-long-chain enoyl-CoA reductase n=1 Tax=Mesorhabditis belari TaxID=2138241 RepID=A0AAF3F2H0_9BILA
MVASFNLEVFDAKKIDKQVALLQDIYPDDTVFAVKKRIAKEKPSLSIERQALRLDPKGKALKDEQKLSDLGIAKNAQLYVRDLGPQISWKAVFLTEYAGPFFIYPLFYMRPSFIYGQEAGAKPISHAVTLACICWCAHYAKRLFETQFIHRFSNGTMPRFNLLKNCGYYWGFCAFVSYFINHPLYTAPYFGLLQIYIGLAGFIVAEFGNLSIHILLRNLRPEGTKERKIPKPDGNPLSCLFNLVSCPNYTYETLSWLFFSIMTQSVPALLFTIAGFVQMTIWAQNKHRAYKQEFKDYPKGRKAIVPFLI